MQYLTRITGVQTNNSTLENPPPQCNSVLKKICYQLHLYPPATVNQSQITFLL